LANVQRALSDPQLKTANAIVPLPFFHFGSDFIGVNANDSTRVEAMSLALIAQIPLVASGNPRVSLTESRNIMNLFGPAISAKNLLSDLDSNTTFYLFQTNRVSEYPNTWYFPKDTSIWAMQDFLKLHEEVNSILHQGDSLALLQKLETIGMSHSKGHILFQDFDFYKDEAGVQEYIGLNEFDPGTLIYGEEYEATVMVYAEDLHKVKLAMIFEKSGEKPEWLNTTHLSQSFTSYGDSSLVSIRFTPLDSTSTYTLFLKNDEIKPLLYRYGKCFIRNTKDIIIEGKFPSSKGDYIRINHIPFKVD